MSEISRSALFGRLNPTGLKAVETATGFCKMRGNPYVELVHWIHILLQDAQNDLAAIRTAFGLNDTQVARDVVQGDEQAYAEIAKQVPIGRAGRPEEIASAVLWLSSCGASYVVGHALTVDGGMTVL